MSVPQVAIVGRPNVGKSSLFNWLARRRIAIVEPTTGVTRDRITSLVRTGDRYFELVDTGGIGVVDQDNLSADVERQIERGIEEADVILFVVDTRTGVTPLDEDVAERLRSVTKPVLCVANKADQEAMEPQAAEFYRLGGARVVCVSALQNRGRDELLRLIAEHLPPADAPAPTEDVHLKVAIVGRRNTGKSTFINCLAESERMIVSEVAGTTRDSVDVRFERDGKVFIAIDTAGVRRKSSLASDLEFYSLHRAERSIRRADVVLLFHDATVEVSRVDKQLANYVFEQHKPAIFVINKWDLMRPMPTEKFVDYFRHVFPNLDFVPLAFITAQRGKNVHAVLNLAQSLHKQAGVRVSTSELNRALRHALTTSAPPSRQNRRPKIFYATQVAEHPPTVVLFVNEPELFDPTYQRYLLKTFRDLLPFKEVPIKMYLRRKRKSEPTPPDAAPTESGALTHRSDAGADTAPEPPEPGPRRKRPASELWDDL